MSRFPDPRFGLVACLFLVALGLGMASREQALGKGLATYEENARYLLDKGEASLLKGETAEALERFGRAARRYKGTLSGAEAQRRIIAIEEGRHRWVSAFDACQDFFEGYPGSPHFLEVLETQIRLALRVQAEKTRARGTGAGARGKGSKGTAAVPDDESVSKMFRLVLENGSHTELGPRIRYNLAMALEREERPKAARVAYAELLETDRTHPLADDAAFQMAYIDYKKVMAGEQSRLFAAQMGLGDFLARYERSEKVAQARHCLEQLGEREAASLLSQARYYEGLGKAEAALVYYDKLFATYFEEYGGDEGLQARVRKLRARVPEGEIRRALPEGTGEGVEIDWPFPQDFGTLNGLSDPAPESGAASGTRMTAEER